LYVAVASTLRIEAGAFFEQYFYCLLVAYVGSLLEYCAMLVFFSFPEERACNCISALLVFCPGFEDLLCDLDVPSAP
jgi:hypothetical protein